MVKEKKHFPMVIHIFENVEGKPDGIGKYVWADNSQHED